MTKMKAFIALVAVVTWIDHSNATYEIPERARGGQMWKDLHPNDDVTVQLRDGNHPHAKDNAEAYWNSYVDHWDPAKGMYEQRFFVNDNYFDKEDPRGIVFLMIGGEGTLKGPPGGFIEELGREYSALLIALEHRFYGKSLPNGSKSTKNYKYLTVEQALGDVAGFTQYVKTELGKPDLRFFTFGGSYPGALSAWYRIAYPELTLGSLSSSGVVNAILEFTEFDEQVATAIGKTCANQLRQVTKAFQTALQTPWKAKKAKALFGVDEEIWDLDFFYMLADSAAMADQYGNKTVLCKALAEVEGEDDDVLMEGFANFTDTYYGSQFGSSCFYDTRCVADEVTATLDERSWRWQKCHELAYFQVAPEKGSLRSSQVNLEYAVEQCERIFGLKEKPKIAEINSRFGGALPQGSRIFYSDFSDDPWQQASVQKEVSPAQPFQIGTCDGCGHCMDLHSSKDSDPQSLKDLRARFKSYLADWLQVEPE